MIRVDASTKMSASSDIKTSRIVISDYTYTWTPQAGNMGFKTKTVKAESPDGSEGSALYGFDASQIGDYTCEAWTVDMSMFVPPAEVTFTEVDN